VISIQENVSLAGFTTFGVGGPARYFVEVGSEAELIEALAWAEQHAAPVFVLGGGSNLVVSDEGWPGLVMRIGLRGITSSAAGEKGLFTAAAGEDWDAFVAHTVAQNCAGMECMSGIPGMVGGTPVQNVGAYGQEVSDTITEVRGYDRASRSVVSLTNAECGFSYRTSIFNTSARDRYIVTAVTYALTPGGAPNVRYADLKKVFAEGTRPTLQEVRDAVRKIRASKGMLIQEGDPDCHSAGSFFKNPIVTKQRFEELKPKLDAAGRSYATYPAGDGHVKLSAAWLVESAGFTRGFANGRVGISSKHTLALVNRGGAMAKDVECFASQVQAGVRERFGIELHPEPVFVGFHRG
jgi:UDP-N-acetylmuramate dehydrogenase